MGVFVILGLAVLVMAIVVLPGACLLTALRQEPMVVWGAGPTVTVLLVAVLTEVFGRIGVPWGPLTGIGSLSLIAVGALGMGLIRGGEPRSGVKTAAIGMWREGHRVLVLAAIPVLLQVCFITRAMGRPGALLQNHDVMFHLNLIELMRSTGWASSLGASAAISGGSFYPSVFHAVAVLLTGVTDVPTAFNATLVGVGICLTIVEVVVLVRAYDGRTMACLVAGAACASTMWTPFLLFFNGQTPTGLAIALLPGALAAMEKAFRTYGLRGRLVLVACLSLGAGCAHPGGGQVLIVLACVMALTGRLIARSESGSAEIAKPALRSRVLVGAAGLLILALMMANAQLQRMAAFPREPRTLLQRVELALFLTPREGRAWDYAWFLLLAGLGLIALGRERSRRLLVLAWSVCAALIVLAQSAVAPLAAVTGAWWGDYNRYLALMALLVGALAGLGTQSAIDWASRHRAGVPASAALAVISLVITLSQVPSNRMWVQRGYDSAFLVHPAWLGDGERRDMETTDRFVFDDAVVYGAPQTGAGLVGVLTGGRSVHGSVGSPSDPRQDYLAWHFRDLHTDPEVCAIIRQEGGTPLFYDDSTASSDEIGESYPGYLDVDTSTGFIPIATLDTATVYRITACEK
ncbi:DUF6541 family protein [Actinomyces dentalis]|uniref:DUF6541 family protein n=1 Tax=Actinomyces dentalis TaxID=272548 RepID=UPI000411E22B|nr:DUF6541 family protein [Actinomyces dentalis]